jgi:hypothetical protein
LERREYGTTHRELLTLGEWLLAEHCPVVAMERTGVSWRPVLRLGGLLLRKERWVKIE